VQSGAIVNTGGGSNTITTPLRFNSTEGLFYVDPASTLTAAASVSGTVNEVQTVVVGAAVTAFALTYNGVDSAVITVSPTTTGDAVQAALQAIPALAGNVTVTGAAGGPYTVTFVNGLGGLNVSALTVNPANVSFTAGTGDNTVSVVESTRGGPISPVT